MAEPPFGKPVGLFGGTFDPVHLAHLRLAEEAVEQLDLDKVRWIPAGQPALRRAPRASGEQRLAMVALAIADNPRFELDAAEVEVARPSYTVHTLERLRQSDQFGEQRSLVLLVGADAFVNLPAWYRWRDLLALAHLAIADRPDAPLEADRLSPELAACYSQRHADDAAVLREAPAGAIVRLALTPLAISATAIRSLLHGRRSVRYLLPEVVVAHIRAHQLYSSS